LNPPLLNRRTHSAPIARFFMPAFYPACVANSFGSSSLNVMMRARCTSRIASVRDAANRLISTFSSLVNG
jgi:hypothetical protein